MEKLQLGEFETEWADYYDDTNYSDDAMSFKEQAVAGMLDAHADELEVVHDLGANTGRFSQIAAGKGCYVVAHDIDELAVERHYRDIRQSGIGKILPLFLDATNPTPGIGWRLNDFHGLQGRNDALTVELKARRNRALLRSDSNAARISLIGGNVGPNKA